jgi:hypothetical protein
MHLPMPIEIKELYIKAVVAPQPSDRKDTLDKAVLERLKREVIRECLQEIKSYLKEQKNR